MSAPHSPRERGLGASLSADSSSTLTPAGGKGPRAPKPGEQDPVLSVLGIWTDFPWSLIYVEIHIYLFIFNTAFLKFISLWLYSWLSHKYSLCLSGQVTPSRAKKKKKEGMYVLSSLERNMYLVYISLIYHVCWLSSFCSGTIKWV